MEDGLNIIAQKSVISALAFSPSPTPTPKMSAKMRVKNRVISSKNWFLVRRYIPSISTIQRPSPILSGG
ncbi:hypothetical protein OI18_01875 [Flavihumibacter solisilvae]|uniref:Uncharacterized protein n=1 Tax=Flavihumibacter solisilvae TaxID=1349421 RepID=A0A0C1J172_9BACT|nr:hypothetical protein OI18_01875 [Flavihumibacter solisilvae]